MVYKEECNRWEYLADFLDVEIQRKLPCLKIYGNAKDVFYLIEETSWLTDFSELDYNSLDEVVLEVFCKKRAYVKFFAEHPELQNEIDFFRLIGCKLEIKFDFKEETLSIYAGVVHFGGKRILDIINAIRKRYNVVIDRGMELAILVADEDGARIYKKRVIDIIYIKYEEFVAKWGAVFESIEKEMVLKYRQVKNEVIDELNQL